LICRLPGVSVQCGPPCREDCVTSASVNMDQTTRSYAPAIMLPCLSIQPTSYGTYWSPLRLIFRLPGVSVQCGPPCREDCVTSASANMDQTTRSYAPAIMLPCLSIQPTSYGTYWSPLRLIFRLPGVSVECGPPCREDCVTSASANMDQTTRSYAPAIMLACLSIQPTSYGTYWSPSRLICRLPGVSVECLQRAKSIISCCAATNGGMMLVTIGQTTLRILTKFVRTY